MKLPNADRAVVPIEKLRNYCFSEQHPLGQHKAKKFKNKLGLTYEDAEWLQQNLRKVVESQDAMPSGKNIYGDLYSIDFPLNGPAGQGTVRSCWIVRKDEDFPRLTNCYVL